MALRPKNHEYQAKIAWNDEDMKKLVFYNILYSLISAALICLVVQFNTYCHCPPTLRLVYLYRENEDLGLSYFDFSLSLTSIVFLKKCGEKSS